MVTKAKAFDYPMETSRSILNNMMNKLPWNPKRLRQYLTLASLRGMTTALGVGKDMLLTGLFGLSGFLDGYFVCLGLVDIFSGYFQQMGYSVLLPLYNDHNEHSEKNELKHEFKKIGQQSVIQAFLIYVFGTVIIAAILTVVYHLWIGYFLAGQLMNTGNYFETLLLTVLPLGIILQGGYALRLLLVQQQKFTHFQWPVLASSALYIGILWFGFSSLGVWAVVLAYLISQVLQFTLYWKMLQLEWPKTFSKEAFDKVFKLVGPASAICIAYYLFIPVDNYFLAKLPAGELSAYRYAAKLVTTISTLTVFSLQMTLIPKLMEAGSEKNATDIQHAIKKGLKETFLIATPLIIAGYFLGPWVIKLLFERGQFTEQNTQLMVQCFQVLIIQLPYIGGWMLISRTFNSLYWLKPFLILGLVMLLLRIVFDAIGMQVAGLQGIIWSTTIHYYLMMAAGFIFIQRRLKSEPAQLES